jgi:hypothetical protein
MRWEPGKTRSLRPPSSSRPRHSRITGIRPRCDEPFFRPLIQPPQALSASGFHAQTRLFWSRPSP